MHYRESASGRRCLATALWLAQITLASVYAIAGSLQIIQLAIYLNDTGPGHEAGCSPIVGTFVGTVELLCSIGMVLPAITHVLTHLATRAALGLSIIQVLAIALHAAREDLSSFLPVNLVLLALCIFVHWGRTMVLPVLPWSPTSEKTLRHLLTSQNPRQPRNLG